MKKIIYIALIAFCFCACKKPLEYGKIYTLSDEVLMDKIKGAWIGQTIGCTYGGPTEFKYKGGIIWEQIPIPWYDGYIYETFVEDPGLYDDVYMDLTFVEVLCEHGIDAPASAFAHSFANADYKLWHANQAARYNILKGIEPPMSGHWKNNPHADDIDFQIEADFIGMLCPGQMPAAFELADKVGHIMNYGDGYYGGLYISAMYSLAYVCNDIPTIVSEALKCIPKGTKFRNCIEDVIKFHKKYPSDWKRCWFEVEQRHGIDIGCPEGVWNGFNIDAVINSAYVVIGLLYGEGDFYKTMDISTRCGHDSDCNPASAVGILGLMNGYNWIPKEWTKEVEAISDMPFPYTSLSLNSLYEKNLEMLKEYVKADANGSVSENTVSFKLYNAIEAPFEQSFEGLKPVAKKVLKKAFTSELVLPFNGNSIVVEGSVQKIGHSKLNYVAKLEAYIDGELVESFDMPIDYIKRKYEIFSKYCLTSASHELKLVLTNPHPDFQIYASSMLVYDNE